MSGTQKYWASKVWALVVLCSTVVEFYAILRRQRHRTLSFAVRCTLRTDTPKGRIAYLAWWCPFAVWFAAHVLRNDNEAG